MCALYFVTVFFFLLTFSERAFLVDLIKLRYACINRSFRELKNWKMRKVSYTLLNVRRKTLAVNIWFGLFAVFSFFFFNSIQTMNKYILYSVTFNRFSRPNVSLTTATFDCDEWNYSFKMNRSLTTYISFSSECKGQTKNEMIVNEKVHERKKKLNRKFENSINFEQ